MEYSKLLKSIENLRIELYLITEDRELLDPEVIAISQQLDQLLNEYNRLSMNLKAPAA